MNLRFIQQELDPLVILSEDFAARRRSKKPQSKDPMLA
jgi:hypothetical protein